MGFWESFRDSYRASRAADLLGFREEAPYEAADNRNWAPPDEPQIEDVDASLRIAELEAALRECMLALRDRDVSLRQRDEQLAEGKQLIVDLAAEIERLGKELKARRSTQSNGGAGDAKFQKLRRFVLKKIHPDLAGGDTKLFATLQAICKNINAEIERIDAS